MEKQIKIHSVKYNFIMNMILKMSSFIFPMITFPYVARVLQASGNGKIAFATAIISYFTLFASLGIPTYGVRVCAQVRDNRDKLSQTVQELLFINILCLIITYVIFIVMMFNVEEFYNNSALLWINSVSIILSAIGVEWFYQAIEQYDYITFRNLAFKVISIIMMFLFVHSPKDYIIYSGIMVLGTVGSNLLNIIRLPKYVTFKLGYSHSIKRHLKPIWILFLYSAATTIYTNLDTIMLGLISGDLEVGYYNAAVKFKTILVSIVTALGAVLLPRISYYIQKNMNNEFISTIKKSFNFILVTSLPIITYLLVETKGIMLLFAGEGYEKAIISMKIIMPSVIFIGISSVTAWQMLIPLGKENVTVVGAIIGGIVDLILNIIFIPKYGAAGAALGTLIAEISVVIVHYIYLRETLKQMKDFIEALKIIVGTGLSTFILLIIKNLIAFNNYFFELVITSIIFFSIYAICLIILKENILYKYFLKQFITKIKSKHVI